MKIFDLKKKPAQWFLLLFLSFIWGASFILMKRGLVSFTSGQVGTIRMFSASVVLLPFLFKRIKLLKTKHVFSLLTVGWLGNMFPALLFAEAQTQVSSSVAGMLNATFPVVAMIIGFLFFKDRPGPQKVFGILIGLLGAAGIILCQDCTFKTQINNYAFLIILAVIMYAFSINTVKHRLSDLDGFTISVFSFAAIAPFAGIALLLSDFSSAKASPDFYMNLSYVILLGIGGSAVSVSLFYVLIEYTDVTFGSLSTYIIPVFALFWGISDGESVSVIHIIFMLIIFIGVFLVNMKSKKDRFKNNI